MGIDKTRVLHRNFCSRCNKIYKRRYSLIQHIKSNHLKVRITCGICSKEYTSTSVRNRHLKKVHGIENIPNSNFLSSLNNVPLIGLSYEPDTAFPSMAKVLSLKTNKTFGKHIVANQDIVAGDVVVAASPFAFIEYLACNGNGCFECGKVTQHKIYCQNCIDVWFCSNQCKASRLHRVKCDPVFERNDCRIVRLATKIITVAINAVNDINTLLQFCRALLLSNKKSMKCHPPYSTYGEIINLKEQRDHAHASIARRVVKYVMKLPQLESFDSVDTEGMKRIFFNLAYRHANSIAINTFAEEMTCSKGGVCIQFSIFDVVSRFNHSCDSNLEHYTDDDEVTYFIASRSIKAGEQLFVNYLCDMEFQSAQDRKNYLKQHWNFDCKCQKCCLI